MKVQRIRISNYRCYDAFDLQVDGEAVTLVAANAGGKTTMLTAMGAALTGARVLNRDDFRDRSSPLEIIVTLIDLDQRDQAAFADAVRFGGNQPSLNVGIRGIWDEDAQQLDVTWGFPDLDWARVGREARERIRVLWLPASRDPIRLVPFVGPRSLLEQLVATVDLDQPLDDAVSAVEAAVARFSLAPGMTKMLSGLQQELDALIPDVAADAFGIEAAASTRRELLGQFELALAHSGERVRVARQSSGLTQLAIFCVALGLIRADAWIVLIDEPEISLHPQAQRSLARAIRTQSTQSIVATHSSNMISGEDLRNIVRLKRRAADGIAEARQAKSLTEDDARRLSRYATAESAEAVFARTVIFVEGMSDYLAVHAAARTSGVDIDARGVAIVPLQGAKVLDNYLRLLGPQGLDLNLRGLCDADAEADWCQCLSAAGLPVDDAQRLNALGFFVCRPDLEAELVKAHGTGEVQRIIAAEGETARFTAFAQQPPRAGASLEEQLVAFARKRKTVWSPRLAAEIAADRIPLPIRKVLEGV